MSSTNSNAGLEVPPTRSYQMLEVANQRAWSRLITRKTTTLPAFSRIRRVTRLRRSAHASCCRWRPCHPGEGLVHNSPNGASTATTLGAASQTPIDLARRSDGAFGRDGSDLVVRNDVTRTNDHKRCSQLIGRCDVFLALARKRVLSVLERTSDMLRRCPASVVK